MRVTFALAVLMTMFLNAARGQEANLSDPDKLRPQLDAALKRILPAQFWGGVAVSKDGTLAYSQGFGASDPPTSNTLVDIGSIAKQFTAATVLKLESEGKLSIEAPVSQWFPVGGMASAVKLPKSPKSDASVEVSQLSVMSGSRNALYAASAFL